MAEGGDKYQYEGRGDANYPPWAHTSWTVASGARGNGVAPGPTQSLDFFSGGSERNVRTFERDLPLLAAMGANALRVPLPHLRARRLGNFATDTKTTTSK